MKVLNSSTAFREHYATRAGDVFEIGKSVMGGGAVATGVATASAAAVGHAAAGASLWSLGSGLPLIGGFCAGKATAAGIAAGAAALGSAAVLLPALAIGGAVACLFYGRREKRPIQKGSSVTELATAFAHVACLPMLAVAVSVCRANPANSAPVQDYLVREMGGWGYTEEYVRSGFSEAMKYSPSDINREYDRLIGLLRSGSTEGIGATPRELPVDVVRAFADEFKSKFESCIA